MATSTLKPTKTPLAMADLNFFQELGVLALLQRLAQLLDLEGKAILHPYMSCMLYRLTYMYNANIVYVLAILDKSQYHVLYHMYHVYIPYLNHTHYHTPYRYCTCIRMVCASRSPFSCASTSLLACESSCAEFSAACRRCSS